MKSDEGAIILGKELADILKGFPGRRGKSWSLLSLITEVCVLEAASFRIKGFIESKGPGYRPLWFITLDAARKLLNYPEGAVSSLLAISRDIKYVRLWPKA